MIEENKEESIDKEIKIKGMELILLVYKELTNDVYKFTKEEIIELIKSFK